MSSSRDYIRAIDNVTGGLNCVAGVDSYAFATIAGRILESFASDFQDEAGSNFNFDMFVKYAGEKMGPDVETYLNSRRKYIV